MHTGKYDRITGLLSYLKDRFESCMINYFLHLTSVLIPVLHPCISGSEALLPRNTCLRASLG